MNIFKLIIFLSAIILLSRCNYNKKEEVGREELAFKDALYPELNSLNDAIEDDDNNAELYYKRAKVYLKIGQKNLALADANKAIQFDNLKAPYYFLLAHIYQKTNKPTLALNTAKKCEALHWQNGELPILFAQIYWELKDLINTQLYVEKAKVAAPNHAAIDVLQGRLLQQSGDSIASLKYYFLALTKDAKNEDALIELSLAYDRQKKEDSAMVFVLKGINANVLNPFFQFQMGNLLAKNHQEAAARECYFNAIRIDSSHYLSSLKIADQYLRTGNDIEALKWYVFTLKYTPNLIHANMETATLLEKLGKNREALPYYRNITVIDPANVKAKTAYERLILLYPVDIPHVPVLDTIKTFVNPDSIIPVAPPDTGKTIKRKRKIPTVKTEVMEISNDIPLVEEPPLVEPLIETTVSPTPETLENTNNPLQSKKKKRIFGKKNKQDTIQ
jgi:tetratricopeptide (TPR) repeat protein